MPVGVLTSITHRITGILLALGIPFGIYFLDLSLQDPQPSMRVIDSFDQWYFKAVEIVFIWALAHHLIATLALCSTPISTITALSSIVCLMPMRWEAWSFNRPADWMLSRSEKSRSPCADDCCERSSGAG